MSEVTPQQEKFFLKSRTLWLNIILGAALLYQYNTEFITSPEAQAALVVVLNALMRLITKVPIKFTF